MSVEVPLEFLSSYTTTALWSSGFDELDQTDIAPETMDQMIEDCRLFWEDAREIVHQCRDAPLAEYWDGATIRQRKCAMAAHDFWLMRCGHGAGFWDGDWPDPEAGKLCDIADTFAGVDLYIGDDGKVYQS